MVISSKYSEIGIHGLQMISKLENNDRSLKQKFPMIYIILAYEKVFFVIFWCTSFKMPSLQYMCKALRESSLHENTVFSVCWRMGSAAYIIFIMQCGCQGEKSSNKKSGKSLRGGGAKKLVGEGQFLR